MDQPEFQEVYKVDVIQAKKAHYKSSLSGMAGPSLSYQGGGNSRMPATAGTISARMIRIQRMTAVCGGIVLISPAK